jgi:autotransporter-associated beta strand protein
VASTAVSALSSYTAVGASGTDSNNSILDSNVTLTGARTTGSLKIDASSGAVTLANGGNNLVLGTATTLAAQILKVGANDAVISGSGALTHSTATAGDFIVRVHAGALTISAPVNMVGTAAFVKSGPGLLALAPSANWVSPNSADAIVAAEGSIRLDTAAAAFGGASCPQFRLSGGVFELTNGSSWLPTIGTGAGNLNWLSTGDGGFAAYGGTRTFGSAVTWDTANHPRNGHAILLNSASANAKIVLSNTINLNTASGTFFFREFRVADNPAETADKAEISGQIVNTGTDGTQGHLLKTGAGTLILSHANNTYNGETIVQNGTLEIASGGKLSAVTAGHGTVSVGQYVVRGVTLAGTLGGFGEIARPVEVLSGGTLNPADASACGTLTVSSTLKVDGIAKFDIRQDGSCDKVAGLTAPPVFGAGAVVRVNFVDASSYRAGTPDLITWTGNALATLPTLETVGLPVGHTATLSSTAGKLTLTVSNQGGTVFLFR